MGIVRKTLLGIRFRTLLFRPADSSSPLGVERFVDLLKAQRDALLEVLTRDTCLGKGFPDGNAIETIEQLHDKPPKTARKLPPVGCAQLRRQAE